MTHHENAREQYDNENEDENLKPHRLLDSLCNSPDRLAFTFAELRRLDEIPQGSICVIGTTPQLKTNSISTIPVSDIPTKPGLLYKLVLEYARATGSSRFFLANVPRSMEQDIRKAVRFGLIMDAAFDDGIAGINEPRQTTVNFGRKKKPQGINVGE